MPTAVHGSEGVLHDVFRGSQVGHEQGRQPDQCRVVTLIQRRHRMVGVLLRRGAVLRRDILSISRGRDLIAEAARPPGPGARPMA
jgi:hypothetical protein